MDESSLEQSKLLAEHAIVVAPDDGDNDGDDDDNDDNDDDDDDLMRCAEPYLTAKSSTHRN